MDRHMVNADGQTSCLVTFMRYRTNAQKYLNQNISLSKSIARKDFTSHEFFFNKCVSQILKQFRKHYHHLILHLFLPSHHRSIPGAYGKR
jgi:hypothetical protein